MDPTPPPSSPRPVEGIEPLPVRKEVDETRPQTTQGEVQQGAIAQRHTSHVLGPERKALQHWAEEASKLTFDPTDSDQDVLVH